MSADPGTAATTARPLLLRGATPVGEEAAVDLLLSDGRIAGRDARVAPGSALTIDLDGLLVAPGFIEVQVNGAAGHDLTRTPESIWDVGAALAPFGVTAFLPTIVTSPPQVVERARAVLAGGAPHGYAGPRPLGLHVEGPFLNPVRHGAHDTSLLRPPSLEAVGEWAPEAGVRVVTLAPELPGAIDVVRALVSRGVVVSAGHSDATAAEAAAGFDAGVRYVTHLFNAMRELGHHEPGLAGAALADPRVTVGLIPDGVHVAPAVVDLAWRLTPGRFSIVTDAIAALGVPPGSFVLGGSEIVSDGSAGRLRDGTLAGSVIGLDRAIRNVAMFTGASAAQVVEAVTATPARLLGLRDRGSLEAGARADVVVLTPRLEVVATIVGGAVVHAGDDRWA